MRFTERYNGRPIIALFFYRLRSFLRNADLISKNEELNIENEELNIRNEELVSDLQIANEKIDKLEDISQILAAKVAQIPDTVENSEFVQELLEAAIVLEEIDPTKASEFLFNLKENPDYLSQVQMTEIDEFAELTTKAQYSVSPQEFAVLSNLNTQEKENLLSNAEVVSKLSVREF